MRYTFFCWWISSKQDLYLVFLLNNSERKSGFLNKHPSPIDTHPKIKKNIETPRAFKRENTVSQNKDLNILRMKRAFKTK